MLHFQADELHSTYCSPAVHQQLLFANIQFFKTYEILVIVFHCIIKTFKN